MRSYFKASILSLLLLLPAFAGFAAEVAAPVATASKTSSFNPILVALATVIILLLFVIAVLGNVLRQLSIVYRDKMRGERNGKQIVTTILLIVAFTLPSFPSLAQEAVSVADTTVAAVKEPRVIGGIHSMDFYVLMFVLVLELLIVFSMIVYMRILLKVISAKPKLATAAKQIVKRIPFWDRFNKVVPIEKEQDIILDHEYDGIRELDNSLPPWWKYGFYLTIVVAVVYLWYYHGGGTGPSSEQEYIAAVKKGEEDKAAYLAKNAGNIDENNVKMADAAGIEEGKTLFAKNCAACHAGDGGGIVGPNLTDEYWLHGGSLPDVFKSIKYGWQDKGMKAWKDDFSPKQIGSLASFVKSLQGTKPASPKEKQGDLYVEGNAAPDNTIAVQ